MLGFAPGRCRWHFFLALVLLLGISPSGANADINPWVAANLYDAGKWDTAGPYTGTPWLHPPTWKPDQDWGVLGGEWRKSANITGGWGGARDELEKKGIAFASAYFAQFAANPLGGAKPGAASYVGSLGTGFFLDLERFAGWKRGYFTTSFAYQVGTKSLSPAFIENEFWVQLTSSTSSNATRLVHLALGQQFWDNTAELVLGRIIPGDDFAFLRLACISLNQAVCGTPITASSNVSFRSYPFATWGARVKVKPASSWYAQAGTYLAYDESIDARFHGAKFSAPVGSGALTMGEFGYLVGDYRRAPFGGGSSKEAERLTGLPGRYKIGGYYDSERVTNQETGNRVYGTWGIYALAEQMLYAENDDYTKGLSVFLALSYSPPSRNLIKFMAAGGLSYQGLFRGRPFDALNVVASYGRYSNALARGQRRAGEAVQDFELMLEINYRLQVLPWLFVQPDIQGIIHPGGLGSVPDALVVGFGFGMTL